MGPKASESPTCNLTNALISGGIGLILDLTAVGPVGTISRKRLIGDAQTSMPKLSLLLSFDCLSWAVRCRRMQQRW